MICQNCGYAIDKGNFCPACRCDATLLNKARTSSLKQYNKGVSAAKEGDYSRAISLLNQCILFDKRNHVARNLLGIAYFEVGMVSDALRQWIISSSINPKNNPATKYIDALQKNARTLEKYDDAIVMYNKAISQFCVNSEDLAIIQLKKAVDFNPKFVEAYNLLALHYTSKNDKEMAKLYIDKALSVDIRNPKALQYLADIASPKGEDNKNVAFKTGYNDKANIKDNVVKILKKEVVPFVLGVFLTFLMVWAIFLPAVKDNLEMQVSTLEERVKALQEENTNGTSVFSLKYKNLEENFNKIKEENENYKIVEENRTQFDNLSLANVYAQGGREVESAWLLVGLNTELFGESDNALIAELKNKVYTFAAKDCYEKGAQFIDSGNKIDAEEKFKEALAFGAKEDFMDNVLYNLGVLNEDKGDIGQAKEFYGRVINEFSGSDVFGVAEESLNRLLLRG